MEKIGGLLPVGDALFIPATEIGTWLHMKLGRKDGQAWHFWGILQSYHQYDHNLHWFMSIDTGPTGMREIFCICQVGNFISWHCCPLSSSSESLFASSSGYHPCHFDTFKSILSCVTKERWMSCHRPRQKLYTWCCLEPLFMFPSHPFCISYLPLVNHNLTQCFPTWGICPQEGGRD